MQIIFLMAVLPPCWLVFCLLLLAIKRLRPLASYAFICTPATLLGGFAAQKCLMLMWLGNEKHSPMAILLAVTGGFLGVAGGAYLGGLAASGINRIVGLIPCDPYDETERRAWWIGRRLTYNGVLAAAGWCAYVAGRIIIAHHGKDLDGDLPWWETTYLMGLGYLVVMALANVCYLLGPGLERFVHPQEVGNYRKLTYAAGLVLACLVPAVLMGLVVSVTIY